VRLLLSQRADPNIADNSGRTPLYFGVYNTQIVSDLLAHGAELGPKHTSRLQYTLANAVQYANPVVIKQLMQRGKEMPMEELDAALERAVYTRQESIAKVLWRRNARIRGRSTALWLAAVQGDVPLMEKLTAYGAKPLQGEWNVVLKLALTKKSLPSLKKALEHGADPNIRNAEEYTPLMRTVLWGETQAVSLLLRYGAKTDVVDATGQTAWTLAQKRGKPDIMRLLSADSP
jgi:ankyrin repeat protein